jgi:hypothetical protein
MASTRKILGQVAPSAATPTTLYIVPSATDAVISSVTVCNRGAVETTFRIAIRQGGAGLSNEHYLYYDVIIAANDTFIATIGLTLAALDVVTVYATLATLSFHIYGQENT